MSEVAKLLLGLTMLVVGCGAAMGEQSQRPETRSAEPYEITRAMETVQDQVVLGDAAAKSKLPKLISEIADRLLAVDSVRWRAPRNARAALIYTLSGGQPRVIREILQSGAAPEAEAVLMNGTLAYVEGREAKAKQILMPIDPMMVAPSLGGYLALSQAALIAKDDPVRAMRLLDEARILAPGTLVEEAALRRSALLADATGDLGRFIASSSQYIRRFQRSVYADSFRIRFADSAVQFGLVIDPIQRAKLTNLLNELESAEQLKLYLMMARSGILKGKIEPARFAAGQAIRLSRETGLESERARFYEAITLILARSPQEGENELATIDPTRLPRRDAELEDVVAKLAVQIQKAGGGTTAPAEQQTASSDADAGAASPAVLIDAAQSALTQADALLKKTNP